MFVTFLEKVASSVQLMQRAQRCAVQCTPTREGQVSRSLLTTPLCFPVITLAPSVPISTIFVQANPLHSSSYRIFDTRVSASAVPSLTFILLNKKLSIESLEMYYANINMHFPFPLSVLSSAIIDYNPDLDNSVRGFEPHRRHCVVVLEQDTFILA